jgi:hypothetical protein
MRFAMGKSAARRKYIPAAGGGKAIRSTRTAAFPYDSDSVIAWSPMGDEATS